MVIADGCLAMIVRATRAGPAALLRMDGLRRMMHNRICLRAVVCAIFDIVLWFSEFDIFFLYGQMYDQLKKEKKISQTLSR